MKGESRWSSPVREFWPTELPEMHACSNCGAPMSAWETERCISCMVSKPRWPSNAEAALFVLEKEERPVSTYDMTRGIGREFGRDVSRASLTVALSSDRRFCWAGRGTYGLFRHGLFPGPRTLSGAARLFLWSWAKPIRLELVAFAMRYAGYRFQQASLAQALRYDPHVIVEGWHCWTGHLREETRAHLRLLGVWPTSTGVEDIMVRCGALIDEAINEHRRRLDAN